MPRAHSLPVKLGQEEAEDLRFESHAYAIKTDNEGLLDPHSFRTALLAGYLALKLGFSPADVLFAAEAGLFHDVGKKHPDSRAWLDQYRGIEVSKEERTVIRRLHTELGPVMLRTANLRFARSSVDGLAWVCLKHHTGDSAIEDSPRKPVLSVVRIADSYDAMTSGEGDHVHVLRTKAQALEILRINAQRGRYNERYFEALAQGV